MKPRTSPELPSEERLQTGAGSMDLRAEYRAPSEAAEPLLQCCAADSGHYPLREQIILYKERCNLLFPLKDSLTTKSLRRAMILPKQQSSR